MSRLIECRSCGAMNPAGTPCQCGGPVVAGGHVVEMLYTNYRGETAMRRFVPNELVFKATEHHPEEQWILIGYDLDKRALRDFALKDFGTPANHIGDAAEKVTPANLPGTTGGARWRSMDSAPKDGTRVLLWMVHVNAQFSDDAVAEGWECAVEAHWIDHNGGGWTWYGLSGKPTHWQPMPGRPGNDLCDDAAGLEAARNAIKTLSLHAPSLDADGVRELCDEALSALLNAHATQPQATDEAAKGGAEKTLDQAYEDYRVRPVNDHPDGFSAETSALRHAFFAGAEAMRNAQAQATGTPASSDEAAKGGEDQEAVTLNRIRPKGSNTWTMWRVGPANLSDEGRENLEVEERTFYAAPAPSEATSGDVAGAIRERYDDIQHGCAHFGGSLPGRCLLNERGWQPHQKPTRCAKCPEARKTGSADGALRERIARVLNAELGSKDDEHPMHHPAQNSWEEPSQVWWMQYLDAADAVIAALSHSAASTHSPTKTDGEFERVRAWAECLLEQFHELKDEQSDPDRPVHPERVAGWDAALGQLEPYVTPFRALLPADNRKGGE